MARLLGDKAVTSISKLLGGGPSYGGGGFNPLSIAGCKLWLKADALVLNNNDPVTTWTDSSGTGNNASQGTGANQPLFKTNILNGNPVVRFDGSNDHLISTFIGTLTQPNTILIVCTCPASSSYVFDGIGTSNRHALSDFGATLGIYAGAGPISGALPVGVRIISAIYNGASSNLYVNGSLLANGDAGTNSLTGITLGARFNIVSFLNGDIAEILIYNTALSDGNRQSVESYLNSKYVIF